MTFLSKICSQWSIFRGVISYLASVLADFHPMKLDGKHTFPVFLVLGSPKHQQVSTDYKLDGYRLFPQRKPDAYNIFLPRKPDEYNMHLEISCVTVISIAIQACGH